MAPENRADYDFPKIVARAKPLPQYPPDIPARSDLEIMFIISLVLCVKARYAILDKYLKFLDLNLAPKGHPRGHLGRPLFHDFRR